jgi:hypothetical protein
VQARRNARGAKGTMENVLKRKVFISKERVQKLKQIYETAKAESVMPPLEDSLADVELGGVAKQTELIRVLLIGFDKGDPRVEQFRVSLGSAYVVGLEKFVKRDWVRMMATARSTYTVDVQASSTQPSGASGYMASVPEGEEAAEAAPEDSKKLSKADKQKRQPQVLLLQGSTCMVQ